jgi:hypothetical protein
VSATVELLDGRNAQVGEPSQMAFTFLIPGSSQRSYASESRITGIRSWTAEVTAFGVVVRIEHVVSHAPRGSFQRSHSPANANSAPSLTSKQNGCFDFPLRLAE